MGEPETDDEQDAAVIQATAERLKNAVRISGGNKEIARISGVPLRTLNSYIAAEADPKLSKMRRIATACGTTIDALMGTKPSSDVQLSALSEEGQTTSKSGDGGSISPQRAEIVATEAVVPEGYVVIPFMEPRASAARSRSRTRAETVAAPQLMFRADWLASVGVDALSAELLQAQGDGMSPTIQDGDLMLVDRGFDEVVHGKIYAFVVDNHVVVKRVNILAVGGMVLISDNARYPPETVSRDEMPALGFKGRIAWYGRAV